MLKGLTVLKCLSSHITTPTRMNTSVHLHIQQMIDQYEQSQMIETTAVRLRNCCIACLLGGVSNMIQNQRKTSSSDRLFAQTFWVTKHQLYSFFIGLTMWNQAEINKVTVQYREDRVFMCVCYMNDLYLALLSME